MNEQLALRRGLPGTETCKRHRQSIADPEAGKASFGGSLPDQPQGAPSQEWRPRFSEAGRGHDEDAEVWDPLGRAALEAVGDDHPAARQSGPATAPPRIGELCGSGTFIAVPMDCSPCSRADEFCHRTPSQSRLEQKTLSHVTPMFAEETSLALPFHAFRHDPQSESMRHGNHCLHDRCVVWVRVTLPDKALVDLDRVYRIAFSHRTTRNRPPRNRQSLSLFRSPAVQ